MYSSCYTQIGKAQSSDASHTTSIGGGTPAERLIALVVIGATFGLALAASLLH